MYGCIKVSRAGSTGVCVRIIKGRLENEMFPVGNRCTLARGCCRSFILFDTQTYHCKSTSGWLASGHYLLQAAYLNFMSLNRGINHYGPISLYLSLSLSLSLSFFCGSKVNSLLEKYLPYFKPPFAIRNV